MNKLFATVDALFPVYLDFWKQIVSIETPSGNAPQLNKMADCVEQFASSRGLKVTRYPFPAAGDCLTVEAPIESGRQPFTFMAHMDTVHPIGAFGPEVVRVEGDKMYGPGCVDCKGGIVTAILALETLTKNGYADRPLKLVLTSDEEVGSKFSGQAGLDFIKEQNRGSAALFNCETGDAGYLTVGRKGICNITVDITGVASHAGNNYFDGASAIREAALKILTIEGMSVNGGTTYNCGVIKGGTVANVVAEKCTFQVDIRALTVKDMEEAIEKVKSIAEHCTVTGCVGKAIVPDRYRPPFERLPAGDLLFERIRSVAAHYGLEELEPQVKGGGSDAVYPALEGVPTVCSTGVCGTGTHSVREVADISSLPRRAKLLAAAVTDFAHALEY